MSLTAATLFSGIGAPEVAMPEWTWLWHAEIEKFPSAVMAARHSSSVNLGDVTEPDFVDRARAIGVPDVLVFGSPCQSFSVAGRRLGLDDPRGNLALVALGIIAALRPRWFVFENVPGLLSSSDGRDFGLFLRAVDELGTPCAWRVLDAQFAGLAQRRKRLFAVGHARDWRYPAAVLLEPESLCGHPPTRQKTRQSIAPTLEGRAGRSGANNFATSGGLVGDIAPTVSGGAPFSRTGNERVEAEAFITTGTLNSRAQSGGGFGGDFETAGGLIPVAYGGGAKDAMAQGMRVDSETVDPLMTVGCPAVAFTAKDYGADAETELSPTLRSGGHDKSHANGGVMPAVAGAGVRRLMPVETERLQGFPDHYTAIPYRGKPAADGPRYKAIGNSMAVPVVRWILTRLAFVDALAKDAERVG